MLILSIMTFFLSFYFILFIYYYFRFVALALVKVYAKLEKMECAFSFYYYSPLFLFSFLFFSSAISHKVLICCQNVFCGIAKSGDVGVYESPFRKEWKQSLIKGTRKGK